MGSRRENCTLCASKKVNHVRVWLILKTTIVPILQLFHGVTSNKYSVEKDEDGLAVELQLDLSKLSIFIFYWSHLLSIFDF